MMADLCHSTQKRLKIPAAVPKIVGTGEGSHRQVDVRFTSKAWFSSQEGAFERKIDP
jgi:hypothetical protein